MQHHGPAHCTLIVSTLPLGKQVIKEGLLGSMFLLTLLSLPWAFASASLGCITCKKCMASHNWLSQCDCDKGARKLLYIRTWQENLRSTVASETAASPKAKANWGSSKHTKEDARNSGLCEDVNRLPNGVDPDNLAL